LVFLPLNMIMRSLSTVYLGLFFFIVMTWSSLRILNICTQLVSLCSTERWHFIEGIVRKGGIIETFESLRVQGHCACSKRGEVKAWQQDQAVHPSRPSWWWVWLQTIGSYQQKNRENSRCGVLWRWDNRRYCETKGANSCTSSCWFGSNSYSNCA